MSLTSLRGKLVLIDFWATWCKPCKRENKKLIDVYNRYSDTTFKECEGFEIYIVSIDRYKHFWTKEVNTQKYNWKYNVFDDRDDSYRVYGVTSIPQNWLIGPDGIFIAKNLRDTAVVNTLNKLLE